MRGKSALIACAPVGIAFGIFVLARMAVASEVPWHRAFDDFFYLPETMRWLEAGRLGTDGTFLRVPMWNLLLGTHFTLFGGHLGLVLLQGQIVLLAVVCQVLWARRVAPGSRFALWLPLLLFLLSPQILLYSRQAVNELLIGSLTLLVIVLGERRGARGALAMGAVAGVAMMTKPSAVPVAVVAFFYVLRDTGLRVRGLGRLAAGFALVVLPLVALMVLQRDSWVLDNSSAYTISGITLEQWKALPDHATRQSEGMAMWRAHVAADPVAYLGAFLARAINWVLRPSSADFAFFYRDYPMGWLKAVDSVAFFVLTGLAIVGTRRRDAFLWLTYLGWMAGCTIGLKTPGTPKIILLFTGMFLATRGIAQLQSRFAAVKDPRLAQQESALGPDPVQGQQLDPKAPDS